MPLVLDLLRHGEALPAAAGGDAERTLSPAGIATLQRLASRLARDGWRAARAFSSPLRRARESAAIVLAAATPAAPLEILKELGPESERDETIASLATLGLGAGHVLLVSHQPLLGRLVARLTGVEPAIAPGTLVRVECRWGLENDSGRIVLTLRPQELA